MLISGDDQDIQKPKYLKKLHFSKIKDKRGNLLKWANIVNLKILKDPTCRCFSAKVKMCDCLMFVFVSVCMRVPVRVSVTMCVSHRVGGD